MQSALCSSQQMHTYELCKLVQAQAQLVLASDSWVLSTSWLEFLYIYFSFSFTCNAQFHIPFSNWLHVWQCSAYFVDIFACFSFSFRNLFVCFRSVRHTISVKKCCAHSLFLVYSITIYTIQPNTVWYVVVCGVLSTRPTIHYNRHTHTHTHPLIPFDCQYVVSISIRNVYCVRNKNWHCNCPCLVNLMLGIHHIRATIFMFLRLHFT